jgi:hypothetical protein
VRRLPHRGRMLVQHSIKYAKDFLCVMKWNVLNLIDIITFRNVSLVYFSTVLRHTLLTLWRLTTVWRHSFVQCSSTFERTLFYLKVPKIACLPSKMYRDKFSSYLNENKLRLRYEEWWDNAVYVKSYSLFWEQSETQIDCLAKCKIPYCYPTAYCTYN